MRKSKSVIGKQVSIKVKAFILENMNAISNDTDITAEQGAEMMADAIAYGISEYFSSSSMSASFNLGICGAGTPGPLIYTNLQPLVQET